MSYTPNYVSSQNVSVFPSAFRRSDDSHKDSYLLTERNLGNLNSSSLDYDSYVEDAGDTVVIVLGGYRFVVVSNALSAIRPENNSLFANIKISNTGNLSSFNDDTTLDVGGNFVGLYFGTTADGDATYSIEVFGTDGSVPEGSKLKIDAKSVSSTTGKNIASEFKTDKISANSGNTITLSSNVVAETGKTITADVSGNATSADKVNHTLAVNLNGSSKSFDGSANVSLGNVFAPTSAGDRVNQLLGSGTPTPSWISSTVGSATQSVYMKDGVITAGSTYAGGTKVTLNGVNKGAADATVYSPESSGQSGQYLMWAYSESSPNNRPVWAASDIGNTNIPIYQDGGVLKACSRFAGGTSVTLNGTPKGADVAVFYAPTSAGTTENQLLTWNGSAITYTLTPSVTSLTASGAISASSVTASGQIQANSFNAMSDVRLKKNVKDFECKGDILGLEVKEFDYENDSSHHIGCIAQDLQRICPEIVHENEDGYLSIEESKIVYLLLNEVKKLKEEVEELKRGK